MDSHNGYIEQSGSDWAYKVVIVVCTYRLYWVHTCMQLCDVDIEIWCYLINIIAVYYISYVSVDDLHVLKKPSCALSHDKLFIPVMH